MKQKILLAGMIMLLLSPLAILQSCKSSKDGKLLKFNLEKGKAYDYEIIWDMDQKMMEQNTQISITGLYTVAVTNDDGHVKELTSSYKSFRMHMNMMGMEIDVDTDKPSPPMTDEEIKLNPMGIMNKVFAAIVGKPFTMKIDEEGKLVEVKGFREMIAGMMDSVDLPEQARGPIAASLNDQFNDQTIKDQFAQVFFIFPNKVVKVGDSWEKSFEMGGKTPAKYSTLFKVKEINGDKVVLTTNTTIAPTGEMSIKGIQTGEITIDAGTGLMTNADFDQAMDIIMPNMKMEIKGKGKIKGRAR